MAGVLRGQFGVGHTTVQVEVEGCAPDELYCTLRPTHEPHAGHDHASHGDKRKDATPPPPKPSGDSPSPFKEMERE